MRFSAVCLTKYRAANISRPGNRGCNNFKIHRYKENDSKCAMGLILSNELKHITLMYMPVQ